MSRLNSFSQPCLLFPLLPHLSYWHLHPPITWTRNQGVILAFFFCPSFIHPITFVISTPQIPPKHVHFSVSPRPHLQPWPQSPLNHSDISLTDLPASSPAHLRAKQPVKGIAFFCSQFFSGSPLLLGQNPKSSTWPPRLLLLLSLPTHNPPLPLSFWFTLFQPHWPSSSLVNLAYAFPLSPSLWPRSLLFMF